MTVNMASQSLWWPVYYPVAHICLACWYDLNDFFVLLKYTEMSNHLKCSLKFVNLIKHLMPVNIKFQCEIFAYAQLQACWDDLNVFINKNIL